MKSYRRNFVRRSMQAATKGTQETRDGVLWDVFEDSGFGAYCLVKIQGTDKLVTAHYTRTQVDRPNWLQPGMAVRMIHRGGIRGYIEVIGPGRAIPMPVEGSVLPEGGVTGNGIVSGMVVTATSPETNSVAVSEGVYRINGVLHHFPGTGYCAVTMQNPPLMTMGVAPIPVMGVFTANQFPPAPEPYKFRYDLIVIGEDGLLEVIAGTEDTSYPTMPATPVGKILLNFALRVYDDAGVLNGRIGMVWTLPRPTQVVTEYPMMLSWDEYDDTPEYNMSATVVDQYGKPYLAPSTGWNMTCKMLVGTGMAWSYDSGYSDDIVEKSLFYSPGTTFRYQRNQLLPVEIPPAFMVSVDTVPPLKGFILGMEFQFLIAG